MSAGLAFFVFAMAATSVRVLLTDTQGTFTGRMYATLAINVVGQLLLGLLVGSDANHLVVVGVGRVGSLTTFSTFASQVQCIGREGTARGAVAYAIETVVLGVGAARIAWTLGT
jgi:CrcB protein